VRFGSFHARTAVTSSSCGARSSGSSTATRLTGADQFRLLGLCRLYAEGSTLRSLRQADVPIGTRQRAVLETAAANLA